jgi:hypothetical protein
LRLFGVFFVPPFALGAVACAYLHSDVGARNVSECKFLASIVVLRLSGGKHKARLELHHRCAVAAAPLLRSRRSHVSLREFKSGRIRRDGCVRISTCQDYRVYLYGDLEVKTSELKTVAQHTIHRFFELMVPSRASSAISPANVLLKPASAREAWLFVCVAANASRFPVPGPWPPA